MFAVFRRNPAALVLAILLHIGLAVFLVLEVDWRDDIKPIGGDVQVVQAALVEQDPYEAKKKDDAARARADAERKALEKRRADDKRKLAEAEAARKKRKEEAARKVAEEQKKAEEEKARQAEIERKKVALEQKEQAEKKRLAEVEAKRKADAEHKAEEKRKADEAVKKAEAEREAKRKAEADAKAKAEKERKERIAKEKAEKERKRKEAAEAKARADRQAREAELAAQFAAEQDASELARVSGLIREKVERNWLRPPGTEGLKCTVSVRLGQNGSVLLVRVVKSSGSIAFDRSVEKAVLKADPLPMPRSERLLAQFRRGLTFIFDPSK